jgi:hypothetical protein
MSTASDVHDHHLRGSEVIAFARPNSPCVAESSGPECGEGLVVTIQGVCRDQLRADLSCPFVAESGGSGCGVDTCMC